MSTKVKAFIFLFASSVLAQDKTSLRPRSIYRHVDPNQFQLIQRQDITVVPSKLFFWRKQKVTITFYVGNEYPEGYLEPPTCNYWDQDSPQAYLAGVSADTKQHSFEAMPGHHIKWVCYGLMRNPHPIEMPAKRPR